MVLHYFFLKFPNPFTKLQKSAVFFFLCLRIKCLKMWQVFSWHFIFKFKLLQKSLKFKFFWCFFVFVLFFLDVDNTVAELSTSRDPYKRGSPQHSCLIPTKKSTNMTDSSQGSVFNSVFWSYAFYLKWNSDKLICSFSKR